MAADEADEKASSSDRVEVRVRLSREVHTKLLKVIERDSYSISTYIARLVDKDMKKQRV